MSLTPHPTSTLVSSSPTTMSDDLRNEALSLVTVPPRITVCVCWRKVVCGGVGYTGRGCLKCWLERCVYPCIQRERARAREGARERACACVRASERARESGGGRERQRERRTQKTNDQHRWCQRRRLPPFLASCHMALPLLLCAWGGECCPDMFQAFACFSVIWDRG